MPTLNRPSPVCAPAEPVNVIWCEWWDRAAGGPEGECRDLGACRPGDLPARVAREYAEADRLGWGCGEVVATDGLGARLN